MRDSDPHAQPDPYPDADCHADAHTHRKPDPDSYRDGYSDAIALGATLTYAERDAIGAAIYAAYLAAFERTVAPRDAAPDLDGLRDDCAD